MSTGFARRKPFKIVAAVDAQEAKPCEGFGKLDCNTTYAANIGIRPFGEDLAELDPSELIARINVSQDGFGRGDLTVLCCCPPCTDFSRTKPSNHLSDSPKNSLVVRCADFVEAFLPEFVVMENARELIMGRQSHHYRTFAERLARLGYDMKGQVSVLTRYGLPQVRERAIVVASRIGPVLTLGDLWAGWEPRHGALTVRHAIGYPGGRALAAGEADVLDPEHRSPGFTSAIVRDRMEAVPRDGGSWYDLANHPQADTLLIRSMKNRLAARDLGSHGDVYGRLAWDRPAPTIKRECAHVGNGRYAHPEQTRLLTVREMSLLQGFPRDYTFPSKSIANRYRHIGDAVPPLIAYQLSALVCWMKTGTKPDPSEWLLPGTTLTVDDLVRETNAEVKQLALAVL